MTIVNVQGLHMQVTLKTVIRRAITFYIEQQLWVYRYTTAA